MHEIQISHSLPSTLNKTLAHCSLARTFHHSHLMEFPQMVNGLFAQVDHRNGRIFGWYTTRLCDILWIHYMSEILHDRMICLYYISCYRKSTTAHATERFVFLGHINHIGQFQFIEAHKQAFTATRPPGGICMVCIPFVHQWISFA